MGSILRFLALAGVISVGSYMLYQAETRLSESESLTQSMESGQAPVSLGESTGGAVPSLDENALNQFEPDPPTNLAEVHSEPHPLRNLTNAEGDSLRSPDLDFNDSNVITADRMSDETENEGVIRLASDESPFGSDPPKTTADEFPEFDPPPTGPKQADPFGESPTTDKADPFGAFVPLDSAAAPPEKKPGTLPALNLPEPEEFPDLEKKDTEAVDPFGGAPDKLPELSPATKPVTEVDPFAPLPTPSTSETEFPQTTPLESEDPFATPSAREPKPFEAADQFNEVKSDQNGGSGFRTLITPLGTTRESVEDRPDSFELPKITPKPKEQPSPFASDEELPKITPLSRPVRPETNPFAAETPKIKVTPASANSELPLITPKKQDQEPDPFSEEPIDQKTPALFPEPLDSKPAPEPTKLEDAFPLPEPSPVNPFGEPETIKKPSPSADAFPALDDPPAVKPPQVADPFGDPEQPSRTEEPALDDSFQFPPLPRATSESVPSTIEKPADEFPIVDPVEPTTTLETPTPRPALPAIDEPATNPLSEFPSPSAVEPVTEPAGFPEPSSDSGLSELNPPAEPKELRDSGLSQPIEPRSVPVPKLVIEKIAPDKAVLKQPFVYHILIKNTGTTPVSQVTVQDQVPAGTKLTGTIPQAELTGQRLTWKLDRMQPGEEKKISVRVIPEQAGPIGSIATVNFVAEVGAETVIEAPKLDFQMVLPPDARVGEVVTCRFDIQNRGDQTITGLILRDVLPEGLHHPSGRDLENPLGDLKPGDRIIEQLQLKITKTGEIVNTAYLGAEGGLHLEATARLAAKPNKLAITRRGPKQRIVERAAIYHNLIKNISDKPVSGAIVVEQLPQGMEFISANQNGEFHEKGHTIFWKLPVLPPGETIVLQSKVIPHEAGTQESLVRVVESPSSKSEIQAISHTEVEPTEALGVVMSEHQRPVLIGDSVIMTIEATNRGNRAAENVRIRAAIPPALSLMNVRGETRFRIEGREVVFEPLHELVPGKKETIQLELKAAASSKAQVSVTIQSDKMKQPLEKASALSVQKAIQ